MIEPAIGGGWSPGRLTTGERDEGSNATKLSGQWPRWCGTLVGAWSVGQTMNDQDLINHRNVELDHDGGAARKAAIASCQCPVAASNLAPVGTAQGEWAGLKAIG